MLTRTFTSTRCLLTQTTSDMMANGTGVGQLLLLVNCTEQLLVLSWIGRILSRTDKLVLLFHVQFSEVVAFLCKMIICVIGRFQSKNVAKTLITYE